MQSRPFTCLCVLYWYLCALLSGVERVADFVANLMTLYLPVPTPVTSSRWPPVTSLSATSLCPCLVSNENGCDLLDASDPGESEHCVVAMDYEAPEQTNSMQDNRDSSPKERGAMV